MADNTSKRGFASMPEEERREIASKGGKASSGKFGSPNGADPHVAGRKGAEAEPRAAKVRGGEHSHENR